MTKPIRQFSYYERDTKNAPHKAYGFKYPKWPKKLQDEFAKYREWRTSEFNLDRPRKLKQRESTFQKSLLEFECFFGYLVNFRRRDPGKLRLADITDIEAVTSYIQWHARVHSGVCRFTQKTVSLFYTIARYYLRVPADLWGKLQDLRSAVCPSARSKISKRARWNSLAELEAVGKAEYPLAKTRKASKTAFQQAMLALQIQRSLIIRLLVRRPLRSRNVRELKLPENLYQENGLWIIEFVGDQMKVSERAGKENVYRVGFPADLVLLLEEWLTWRPLVNVNGLPNLFVTRSGQAFTQTALNTEFKKTVFAYTGKATNIHLVRDVWATEYILATHDIVGAAQVLGDEIETVLRHYAHLLQEDASEVADKFVKKALRRPRK